MQSKALEESEKGKNKVKYNIIEDSYASEKIIK